MFFQKKYKTITAIITVFLAVHHLGFTQTINANLIVNNIPVKKGMLFIGFYNKTEGFRKGEYAVYQKKVTLNGENSTKIPLQNLNAGVYAICLFYDENFNGTMDTNFLGIPNEKYGFSNNVYPYTRAATFDESKFSLNQQNQTITINLK